MEKHKGNHRLLLWSKRCHIVQILSVGMWVGQAKACPHKCYWRNMGPLKKYRHCTN